MSWQKNNRWSRPYRSKKSASTVPMCMESHAPGPACSNTIRSHCMFNSVLFFVIQVTRKGKSVSPGKSPTTQFRSAKGQPSPKKETIPHDYYILRISPCPAETLKDLVSERRWMFKCRNMLLYITHKLHALKEVGRFHPLCKCS